MSERVCYISRQDRGGRIDAIRIVGAHSDDRWSAPAGGAVDPRDPARRASEWIHSTLSESSRSRAISTLCLDVDGGVCSWVSAAAPDPTLIRASVEGATSSGADDELDAENGAGETASARFPDLPGETTYEPLAEGDANAGGGLALLSGRKRAPSPDDTTRMAVLGVPDVPARLLLDELDSAGVRVGRTVSIWHAAAQAWDPSGPGSAAVRGAKPAAAEHAPVTAIVVLDPDAGRLIWAWSSRGGLLTGGSMRLRTAPGNALGNTPGTTNESGTDDAARPVVCAADLGRLTAEWLSWSIQLGHAPARVVWVGSVEGEPDGEPGGGLTPAGVGEALGSRWPDAAVDLIEEDDPIGVTLRRVVAAEDLGAPAGDAGAPQRAELPALAKRPGKANRALHMWAGLALVLGGLALGAVAWRQWNAAADARGVLSTVNAERRQALESASPALVMSPFPVNELRGLVRQEQDKLRPSSGFPEPTPILEQLEAFTLVLGAQQIHLTSVDVTSLSASIQVRVDDIALVEQIDQALRSVADPRWGWSDYNTRRDSSGSVNATYNAVWRP